MDAKVIRLVHLMKLVEKIFFIIKFKAVFLTDILKIDFFENKVLRSI